MRLALLLMSFLPAYAFCQNIAGKVTDEKGNPLSSATVLLLKQKDSALVSSVLSDSAGSFHFSAVKEGKYLVASSMSGFRRKFADVDLKGTDIQLGNIALARRTTELREVTVTAVKPFLEQKIDRLVINIEGSATAAGSTAFEVLQKVPGVLVINDKLTVVGKGTPSIMIDGRLSQYTDMTQVLRDMSAANIEKIELITNPGAKYDATGGAIINIILKRNANLGTNGNINLSGVTGIYNRTEAHTDQDFYRINAGFNINHRKGKVNLYGGYSFIHRTQFQYNEFDRLIPPSRFFQSNYEPGDVTSHNYRAGIDYYADSKNTFGVIVRGFARNGLTESTNYTQQLDASNDQLVSSFNTFNNTSIKRVNTSENINWKHNFDTSGRNLNIDIDYSTFKLNNNSDITNQLANGTKYLLQQYVDNPVQFLVLKADYEHPINKKGKFEAGIKSSFATINNYLSFTQNGAIDTGRSTDFKYSENINAAYSSLQYDFDKWKVQGGLRAEQTIATGKTHSQLVLDRNYWQLFPSLFITRKISKDLSTILQYSRRVNRPSYQQQNPFIEYLDSLTYTRGNPLLKPETADQYKVALAYKDQPFFSVSYNKKHDVIFDDAPKQEGNLTYTTPENLAQYENIAIELDFPIEFGKKISGYGGNQAIYNHYKADYLGATYDRAKWNWLVYWQVAFKPTPSWNFEVSGYYMTQLLNEFIIINDQGSVNFAAQRFLWNKKGRLTLNFNDILFSQKTRGSLVYQAIDVQFRQWSESRNIRLTFIYSFGNQKLKAVRSRQTASDEEAGRVKTNN